MEKESANKEYDINTMQDIFNLITIDNADNFITDFRKVISRWLLIKEIANQKDVNPNEILVASVKWIDDGKHEITTTFIEKKKE